MFWKKQNYGDNKKDQWLPEVGGKEGGTGRIQKIFRVKILRFYNDGHMSLYNCLNQQTVHHQEKTLM